MLRSHKATTIVWHGAATRTMGNDETCTSCSKLTMLQVEDHKQHTPALVVVEEWA